MFRHLSHKSRRGKANLSPFDLAQIFMEPEASGFPPTLCEWCTFPSIDCPLHDIPKILPYRESDPSSIYNELRHGINPSEAGGESSTLRLPHSISFAETEPALYREPGPSSLHYRANPFEADGGESPTRLPGSTTFLETDSALHEEPNSSSLHNEVIDGINPSDSMGGDTSTAQNPRLIVASAAQVAASNSRRKTNTGRFPCDLCSQTFTAKHNLQNHFNSHYRRKNYHCEPDGCGGSFTTKSSLKRHGKSCKGKGVAG